MAKISLETKAKQLFGQAMAVKVDKIGLITTEINVGTNSTGSVVDNLCGMKEQIDISLATQDAVTFFKTKNSVLNSNPLLFTILSGVGNNPKRLIMYRASGGAIEVGVVIKAEYNPFGTQQALLVDLVSIEVKGDGESL